MTTTIPDPAEVHQAELLRRMSAALSGLEDHLHHDERDVRQAACACQLLLIGALTAPQVSSVQGWTCVRWHIMDCLHDDTRAKCVREVYRRVLAALDGK